jgi:hypothetical protein
MREGESDVNMKRLLPAAGAFLALIVAGCGTLHDGAAMPPKAASAAPATGSRTVGSPMGVSPHAIMLNFTRPINISLDCEYAGYAGTLTISGLLGKHRAAAIVTIDGSGTPRWNSRDGHRWTQAEANAVSSTFQPWLYTPWRMHVTGPVLRGQVPPALTGYLQGGKLGADVVGGCGPTAAPVEGKSYLAVFGTELTTGVADGAVQAPVIADLMPYDPATHMLQTRYGSLNVSP